MTALAHHPRRTGIPWLGLAAAFVGFAILIGLGNWQVRRLGEKEHLLATIDARMHATPLPLADVEAQYARGGDVDYTPVTATGAFHHSGERHFLATFDGQSGFFVFTPLELADGRILFVNRGFVPYDLKDAAKRPQGQVQGEITVTGLARNPLSGKPSWLIPDNDPRGNIFYWKDRDAMARSAGLTSGSQVLPFFVDADATPNPGGYPVGGVTLIDLPNNHLQYALTWYGLAAALVGVFGVKAWRGRSRTGGPLEANRR